MFQFQTGIRGRITSILKRSSYCLLANMTSLCTPRLDNAGAFDHVNGAELRGLVAGLIQKDADSHHVFFNSQGFHNHLVHLLLADYSLGASENRLKEIYEIESPSQRPKLPEKSDFVWSSDHCLGHEEYYTSYLNFFLEQIKSKGVRACIEEYIFRDDATNMYARFFSGVYHPFIHIGYGVEFGIPMLVAEGLAQTAVHGTTLVPLYSVTSPIDKKTASGSSTTATNIALSTRDDHRFDDIVKWEDSPKIKALLQRKPDLVREHVDKWIVSETLDRPTGLRARATELQALAAALYAGPQRPGKQITIDFFLMHAFTSSLFVHSYIEFLNPRYGAALLRGKFAVDLAYYISRNRPLLNLEQFKSYPLKSWSEIISKAISHGDSHVPKSIRAVKHAAAYDTTIPSEIYQAIATITVDPDRKWSSDGIGFDEEWQDVPDKI
ncbi:unnamed protein product [Didymodactylos carnosus]|uniref:HypA-like protein n=1 Tax=Didymodactylos carnosus TaxID=1234261 RepID=A0A814XLB6_9BILA|nr:unnamed protein product [Didymodactylos carnosus]CAF1218383.1 unnamed protein product [Didymodactylos carnosus]CAF3981970.1 unnamed protein product [Didymodactylos carnosus]CAF4011424.1 unnamed protein product [Didymodactylos carnosus]